MLVEFYIAMLSVMTLLTTSQITCDRNLSNIVNTKAPLLVLVDESTSLGQKSNLIVYLRFSVDKVSEPVSVFLDIIELESGTADAVLEALLGF